MTEPADRATWQAGIDYVDTRDGKRFHGNEFTAFVTDRVVAETGLAPNEVQAGFARTALRAKGVIRLVGDGWWQPTGETTTVEELHAIWEERPQPVVASKPTPAPRKKAPPKPMLCPFCHFRHEGGRSECLH